MASTIAQALLYGYTPRVILNQVAKQYPQYANVINGAQAAGYTADYVLSQLSEPKESKNQDPDKYLTEHERVQKRDTQQKNKAAMQVLGVLGTAGAVGAGAYAYSQRNRAIRPNAILPAQRGQQGQRALPNQTINQKNQYLPNHQLASPNQQNNPPVNAQQGLLPYGPLQPNQPIQPPTPSNPNQPQVSQTQQQSQTSNAPQEYTPRNPMQNVDLVNNVREQSRFSNIIKNGYDPVTAALILRKVLPKHVLPILEKAEGGLEGIVEDYSQYLAQQALQQSQQKQQQLIEQMQDTQEQENNPAIQEEKSFQEQGISPEIEEQAQLPPIEITNKIEPLPKETSIEQPRTETVGNTVMLPKGDIGEIQSINNGVARINVNGRIKDQKLSEIQQEPQGIENAVRQIIDSIPEEMKSTNLQSIVHVPGINLLLTQFYNGKWAWYKDVPEDIYRNIALGTYEPKTSGETGIGKYKPGVADSRGAGFSSEIVRNPKYSKENKGITWGYANNEYALLHHIQPLFEKISKEKKDEFGNIKVPKKRKKSTT